MSFMFAGIPFSAQEVGENKNTECEVCGLVLACDSKTSNVAAAYAHVTRAHPEAYEAITGFPPDPDTVRHVLYGLSKGFIETTEVGPWE